MSRVLCGTAREGEGTASEVVIRCWPIKGGVRSIPRPVKAVRTRTAAKGRRERPGRNVWRWPRSGARRTRQRPPPAHLLLRDADETQGTEAPTLWLRGAGKGPLKNAFEDRCRQLNLTRFRIATLWLDAPDYPIMLGPRPAPASHLSDLLIHHHHHAVPHYSSPHCFARSAHPLPCPATPGSADLGLSMHQSTHLGLDLPMKVRIHCQNCPSPFVWETR